MTQPQPKLTVDQIKNIRAQAIATQNEDKNDFLAAMCEEIADDLLHMHKVAEEQQDNLMKWKTR